MEKKIVFSENFVWGAATRGRYPGGLIRFY